MTQTQIAAALETGKRYDYRIAKIAALFGDELALYADRNLAGWLVDLLSDDRLQTRTPKGPGEVYAAMFEGIRVCDGYMTSPRGRDLAERARLYCAGL